MIPGYELDLSITLHDFLIGISAFIGGIAIVFNGFRWFFNKLNKNTTIIKSILPFLRIGEDKTYLPIKSQHEFSQIIREFPLELLQVSSLAFFVRFNSINKNESKIEYKSFCQPRFGIKWIYEIIKENKKELLTVILSKTKSYFFNKKQYEEYIFKSSHDPDTIDTIQNLECEFPLDPVSFLSFYKALSINIRVVNSDKSHTSWCKCKLNIGNESIKAISNKVPVLKTPEAREEWLKTWKEEFDKNNEAKFDLGNNL